MVEERHELARRIRCLMRGTRSAALSTALTTADSWPYGSLVTVAIDQDTAPLLLMSTLSDHTRNLCVDNRGALLFLAPSRYRNPQRNVRVTVMGQIRKTNKVKHADRFLAMHPEAAMYSGFGDFDFYRMNIEKVHWIGGFAEARWFPGKFIRPKASTVRAVAESQLSICRHMNEDHGDAIDLYARRLLNRHGDGWRMVGLDPDGADLARDGWFARLNFPDQINDPAEARKTLVNLVAEARKL